jgi:hypothetical protein
MTTGTIDVPSTGPYQLGIGFYKTWFGYDGKTTTFAGTTRDKWNNYTCTVESWRRTNLSFTIKWRATYSDNSSTVQTTTYTPGFGFEADHPWTNNDTLKLYSRLLEKIKSHDFNLAVNLGQLHQTVDLLSSNLSKLGRAALALKRGNFATAARQLGARPRGTRLKTTDISGRWLELQYGWLPLLGDSFEAAKAFEAISAGPRSQIYRASNKRGWVGNGSQSPTLFEVPYQETRKRYIQFECVEEMGFARQLGLLDPLSVAWELTPWSFVVDWFIPIGAYLDVVNQVPTLKGRFLITEVIKKEGIVGVPRIKPAWYNLGLPTYRSTVMEVSAMPQLYHKLVKLERLPYDALPVPFPNFHLGGAVKGKRLWNAISLAQQRFARSFRV